MKKLIIATLVLVLVLVSPAIATSPVYVEATLEEVMGQLETREVFPGGFDPWDYDTDISGYIEVGNLLVALDDYYAGVITLSEVLEVISLYQAHTSSIISKEDIIAALDDAFQEVYTYYLHFGDSEYIDARMNSINEVVESDTIDMWAYRDFFDCEDFAFGLMGAFHHNEYTAAMAIFVFYVSWEDAGTHSHALNGFYNDGQIILIEPQNDRFFTVPEDWTLDVLMG